MDETHARELLTEDEARLRAMRDTEELRPLEGQMSDAGAETMDRSQEIGELEDWEAELGAIADALRRLDEGTYGLCEVCGKPIPDERLEANPTARYDVEHQRAVESGRLPRSVT